jgi:hypothetical protein
MEDMVEQHGNMQASSPVFGSGAAVFGKHYKTGPAPVLGMAVVTVFNGLLEPSSLSGQNFR